MDWCWKWLVDFNAKKSQLVSFDWSNNPGSIDLTRSTTAVDPQHLKVKEQDTSLTKNYGITINIKIISSIQIFIFKIQVFGSRKLKKAIAIFGKAHSKMIELTFTLLAFALASKKSVYIFQSFF